MPDGYFPFPRDLAARLSVFQKDEQIVLVWVYSAVKYTGPDRGAWRGSLSQAAAATGLSKTAMHRALGSLHGREIEYSPTRSRWQKSKIRILRYRTAKDYRRELST